MRGLFTDRFSKNLANNRPIIESDSEKRRRIHAGYTKIVTINARNFISQWESIHGKRDDQTFAWNNERLKSALARDYDDAYPRVTRNMDVEDGRHRIAAAVSNNKKYSQIIREKAGIAATYYKI